QTRDILRASLFALYYPDTATTKPSTLSLHDALPISTTQALARLGYRRVDHERGGELCRRLREVARQTGGLQSCHGRHVERIADRSEEHTSELQSRENLVCRLLLEKKKKNRKTTHKQK